MSNSLLCGLPFNLWLNFGDEQESWQEDIIRPRSRGRGWCLLFAFQESTFVQQTRQEVLLMFLRLFAMLALSFL